MPRFPQADYCHRDALAMVRVVEKLEGLARLGLNKPNGYLLGSYRIATAPEPNSSRLTSLKSIRFDSPRTTSVRGPLAWAAPRTRTHRSIPAPPTPTGASHLPLKIGRAHV